MELTPGAAPIPLNSLFDCTLRSEWRWASDFILLVRRAHPTINTSLCSMWITLQIMWIGVPTGRTDSSSVGSAATGSPDSRGSYSAYYLQIHSAMHSTSDGVCSLFCYSGDEGGILPPVPKYSGFPYTLDSAWFLRVLREPPSTWIAKSTFPRTGLKVNRDSGLSKPHSPNDVEGFLHEIKINNGSLHR